MNLYRYLDCARYEWYGIEVGANTRDHFSQWRQNCTWGGQIDCKFTTYDLTIYLSSYFYNFLLQDFCAYSQSQRFEPNFVKSKNFLICKIHWVSHICKHCKWLNILEQDYSDEDHVFSLTTPQVTKNEKKMPYGSKDAKKFKEWGIVTDEPDEDCNKFSSDGKVLQMTVRMGDTKLADGHTSSTLLS